MNNSPNRKRLIVISLSILALLIIFISAYYLIFSVKVTFLIAPSDSFLTINGKSYDFANNSSKRFLPGDYEVSVKRSGFEDYSTHFTVKFGEHYDLIVALSPDTTATADWYNDHADDALIAEAFTDQNLSNANAALYTNYPLIEHLAYHQPNYVIDYNPCDDHHPEKICIFVTAVDGYYDEAFSYLKSTGYNLADYNFRFPFLYNIFESYWDTLKNLSADTPEKLLNNLTSAIDADLKISDLTIDDTWAYAKLAHTNTVQEESYTNTYRIIMKKSGSSWKIITLPSLFFSYNDYSDIPKSIISGANNL